MTPTEFYDNEHGTRHALAPTGGLCDSDRNIMADLQHEACESHCDDCGRCITDDRPIDLCDDCDES